MTKSGSGKKGDTIGQYILGKTIGEGTFGKVRLGTHVLTGETVAVKILERARIKEIADVERVAREIHILKRVRHPHIIQLYEIIETPTQLFLIMEYCEGGELFYHIVECGRVPEPDANCFFQQILSGIEQVHKINVVHRDLKPENLLLDKDKKIKIVDFGLSNIYKEGQLLKTACGSPCYAAPEMIAGHWYEPSRCDVWSSGVILFALVCGYLPFEDGNTAALYKKIMAAEYKCPNFISDPVKELIGQMLTTDPEKRVTIAEIRQHKWYKQEPDMFPPSSPSDSSSQSKEKRLDEDILQQLGKFGFKRSNVVQSIKENKHNAETTSYYLLLEKKRCQPAQDAKDKGREGIDRISEFDAFDDDSELKSKEDDEASRQTPGLPARMRHSRKTNTAGNLQTGEEVAADTAASQGNDQGYPATGAAVEGGKGKARAWNKKKGNASNGNGKKGNAGDADAARLWGPRDSAPEAPAPSAPVAPAPNA